MQDLAMVALATWLATLALGALAMMFLRRTPKVVSEPVHVRLDEDQYQGWLSAMDPYANLMEDAPTDADELEYQLMLAAGDFFLQQGSGETMAQFAATLEEINDLPETTVDEGWQS